MRVRVVPSIVEYAARTGRRRRALAFGFAGFLAFQDGALQAARRRDGGIGTGRRGRGVDPVAVARRGR